MRVTPPFEDYKPEIAVRPDDWCQDHRHSTVGRPRAFELMARLLADLAERPRFSALTASLESTSLTFVFLLPTRPVSGIQCARLSFLQRRRSWHPCKESSSQTSKTERPAETESKPRGSSLPTHSPPVENGIQETGRFDFIPRRSEGFLEEVP